MGSDQQKFGEIGFCCCFPGGVIDGNRATLLAGQCRKYLASGGGDSCAIKNVFILGAYAHFREKNET